MLGWLKTHELDIQDKDGFTSLHLAIRTAENVKSGRPLRALLQHGASKTIKSHKGQTAFDLTKDIESASLRAELRDNLTNNPACGCLMLTPSLSKIEKSFKMPFAFLVLFAMIYAVVVLFLFPGKYRLNKIAVWPSYNSMFISGGFGAASIFFWIWAQCSDPGFIRKP